MRVIGLIVLFVLLALLVSLSFLPLVAVFFIGMGVIMLFVFLLRLALLFLPLFASLFVMIVLWRWLF